MLNATYTKDSVAALRKVMKSNQRRQTRSTDEPIPADDALDEDGDGDGEDGEAHRQLTEQRQRREDVGGAEVDLLHGHVQPDGHCGHDDGRDARQERHDGPEDRKTNR